MRHGRRIGAMVAAALQKNVDTLKSIQSLLGG